MKRRKLNVTHLIILIAVVIALIALLWFGIAKLIGAFTGSGSAPEKTQQNVSNPDQKDSTKTADDSSKDSKDKTSSDQDNADSAQNKEDSTDTSKNHVTTESTDGGPIEIDGIALVNKKHGVAMDYAPGENPEAAQKATELITAMQNEGLDVSPDWSSFRSYETQSDLYNNYVAANGQAEADTFSARPGYSEHQTGLAFDLKHSSGELITNQPEAQWLLDHAADYGFIVRYQDGWEDITGYMPEPWHIRYIGEKAKEIADTHQPLETYLGDEGGDYVEA